MYFFSSSLVIILQASLVVAHHPRFEDPFTGGYHTDPYQDGSDGGFVPVFGRNHGFNHPSPVPSPYPPLPPPVAPQPAPKYRKFTDTKYANLPDKPGSGSPPPPPSPPVTTLPATTKPVDGSIGAKNKGQGQPRPTSGQKYGTAQQSQAAACNWCLRSNCNPGACKPAANFNPTADAKKLSDAMDGLGTKEEVLFDILINRSEEQIELIKQAYLGLGKNSLEHDVASDTSLDVEDLLLALLKSRREFYADELHYAFRKLKHETMILFLTSLPPCAIKEISSTFYNKHGVTLMKAAKKGTVLKFQEFLEEIIKANRDPEGMVDNDQVMKDAEDLYKAGPNSKIKKKRVFINIFTHRSFDHIRKLKEKYNEMYALDLETTIAKHSGGGKLTEGLLAVLNNVEDQPAYFADEVEGALQHLITNGMKDNPKFIGILRGRCGIDLADIRDAYPENHDGKKLVDVIKQRSFFDYKKVLITLLT